MDTLKKLRPNPAGTQAQAVQGRIQSYSLCPSMLNLNPLFFPVIFDDQSAVVRRQAGETAFQTLESIFAVLPLDLEFCCIRCNWRRCQLKRSWAFVSRAQVLEPDKPGHSIKVRIKIVDLFAFDDLARYSVDSFVRAIRRGIAAASFEELGEFSA